VVDLAVSLNY